MADEIDDEFSGYADGYDAGAMEARMKSGGQIPPGRYHAKLDGAKRTESKAKNTPGWELTFTVTDGPFAGTEVTDTIWITDNSRSRDRLALFGHRLGLLKRTPDGKGLVRVEGKKDLMDCLDTQVVIEVIHEPDQKDPNKHWVRLAFCGIYDPKDPDAMKGAKAGGNPTAPKDGGKTPAKGGAAAAAPATGTANKRDTRRL